MGEQRQDKKGTSWRAVGAMLPATMFYGGSTDCWTWASCAMRSRSSIVAGAAPDRS